MGKMFSTKPISGDVPKQDTSTEVKVSNEDAIKALQEQVELLQSWITGIAHMTGQNNVIKTLGAKEEDLYTLTQKDMKKYA